MITTPPVDDTASILKALMLNAGWVILGTKAGRMSCQKDVELVKEEPCSGS